MQGVHANECRHTVRLKAGVAGYLTAAAAAPVFVVCFAVLCSPTTLAPLTQRETRPAGTKTFPSRLQSADLLCQLPMGSCENGRLHVLTRFVEGLTAMCCRALCGRRPGYAHCVQLYWYQLSKEGTGHW